MLGQLRHMKTCHKRMTWGVEGSGDKSSLRGEVQGSESGPLFFRRGGHSAWTSLWRCIADHARRAFNCAGLCLAIASRDVAS